MFPQNPEKSPKIKGNITEQIYHKSIEIEVIFK